jgi:ABC-2 type transport system permease protein
LHNCCETTRAREPAIRVKLPAVWVLPRFMAFGGWTVLAACVLIEEFGRPLQLSKRVLDLSPFAHVPKLPGGDVSAAPLMWLVLVVVVLAVVGLLGFQRRDVL